MKRVAIAAIAIASTRQSDMPAADEEVWGSAIDEHGLNLQGGRKLGGTIAIWREHHGGDEEAREIHDHRGRRGLQASYRGRGRSRARADGDAGQLDVIDDALEDLLEEGDDADEVKG